MQLEDFVRRWRNQSNRNKNERIDGWRILWESLKLEKQCRKVRNLRWKGERKGGEREIWAILE